MPNMRIVMLAVLLVIFSATFLIWGLSGRIWFILELRGVKLTALIVVGCSVGVSTVLFQTISGNRILTPSIMGFDALFILIQTMLVFTLGGFGYTQLPQLAVFGGQIAAMVLASLALFSLIHRRSRHDLQMLILVGVIFGLMFRSMASFLQRVMDPSEFAVVQGAMFASFGGIDRVQLLLAGTTIMVLSVGILRWASLCDVVALGRGPAQSLGVNYNAVERRLLIVITVLVSCATALVGPITFLGLLAASLAHALMRTHRHILLLPAAAMIAAIILVAGQALFERVLGLQSTLAVVVEFAGGVLFLILLIQGKIR